MSPRGAQIGSQSCSVEEGEVGTSGGSGCHVCARSLRLKATKARSKRSNCCLLSAFCSLNNAFRCFIDESFESILEISAACLARSSLQLGTSNSIPSAANNQYNKANPANQQWRRLRIRREPKQHCRTCGDHRPQQGFAKGAGEQEAIKPAQKSHERGSNNLPQQAERLCCLHAHLGTAPTGEMLKRVQRAGMGPRTHLAGVGHQSVPLALPLT